MRDSLKEIRRIDAKLLSVQLQLSDQMAKLSKFQSRNADLCITATKMSAANNKQSFNWNLRLLSSNKHLS